MKHYKTYFKFLQRNKLFTLVNLAGLSISLMFVLLIADMVMRQLTVDSWMKDKERTFIFSNGQESLGHYNLGTYLHNRFPEIEEWCAWSRTSRYNAKVNGNNIPVNVTCASKDFVRFFGVEMRQGQAENTMRGDRDIVLTESAALKIFGTENCLGKTLQLSFNTDDLYTVTGVIADFDNSIFSRSTELIAPFENMKYINPYAAIEDTQMGNAMSCELFLRTAPGTDLNNRKADIVAYLKEIFWVYRNGMDDQVHFEPVADLYFSDIIPSSNLNQYNPILVMVFLIVGILILCLAVFNYVGMSVAQTGYRAKEMATRRLLGSSRQEIFWRMIAEAMALTVVGFLIAFLLAKAMEPYAMELLGVRLDIFGDLPGWPLTVSLLAMLLIGGIAGIAPASILAGFKPIDVVKGSFRRKTKTVYLRTLSILQSAITMALLCCSLYLSVQIYRVLHAPLGYEYGKIIEYPAYLKHEKYDAFQSEAMKLPFVKRVAFCRGTPNNGGNNASTHWENERGAINMSFQHLIGDSAFVDMFHIQITEDRHLTEGVFVSENAMKQMVDAGFGSEQWSSGNNTFMIGGVFKDFKIRSLLDEPHPLLLTIADKSEFSAWQILVELTDESGEKEKAQVDRIYRQMVETEMPYDSNWYHELVEDQYQHFIRVEKMMLIFTGTALLISLLGLVAMNIYYVSQHKRDMAIRKVFGSDSRREMLRLQRVQLQSLGVSLLIAALPAYFGLRWIDNFLPYEGGSTWQVAAAVVAVVFITAVSVVSVWLIGLKAVSENPIKYLTKE